MNFNSLEQIIKLLGKYELNGYTIKLTGKIQNQTELSLKFDEENKTVDVNVDKITWEELNTLEPSEDQTIYELTDEQLKVEYLKTRKTISLLIESDNSIPDSEEHYEVGLEIDDEQLYLEELAIEIVDRFYNLKPNL